MSDEKPVIENDEAEGFSAGNLDVFLEVHENWYGNFRIADDVRYTDTRLFVKVSLVGYLDGSGWKVAVWGNDDCGMEREFPTNQRKEALQLYIDIVTKRFPTGAWLGLKGLESA